jgi:DNA-binding MarR family transcriptional regulator
MQLYGSAGPVPSRSGEFRATVNAPLSTRRKATADGEALALAVHELLRRVRFDDVETVCSWGLTRTECHVLEVIALGAELSVNQVAARIRLNKSTASRVLQSLESKRLVKRTEAEDDRRSVRIAATAKGMSLWKQIVSATGSAYDDVLAECTQTERKTVTRVLRRIAEQIGRS